MKITNCQLNHLKNPVGFELKQTVFHWTVEEAEGKKQTAARIVVQKAAGSQGREEMTADTGWTALNSLAAPLDLSLEPRTRYTWTVAVRTDAGEEAVSGENFFETGKMAEPWQAEWIGCHEVKTDVNGGEAGANRHPVFHREIPMNAVVSARLYICGLGMYEAYWNGKRIGQEYLTPYCTNYNAWVQYQTFDLTDLIRKSQENHAESGQTQGEPAQPQGKLAILLGTGWYKGRFGFARNPKPFYGEEYKLIAELHLRHEDGSEQIIGTDESWMVRYSNITFSNIYDGEWRDDTLPAVPAVKAVKVEPPKGVLKARRSLPVVIKHVLPVQELLHTPAGETVLDLGQNMAGSFRLHVHGVPYGGKVHLQFGEVLQDGNFYRDNLRSARAEYVFTSDGKDVALQPHFTYYGYRYVKITGMPALEAEDFEGLVLYSDLDQTGALTTGNAKINRLILNAEWGKRGNFIDVPTDCPQRDERMGWTGDAEVFSPTALYQSDAYAFYAKFLQDVASEQAALGGSVPDVVPTFGMNRGPACGWSDATVIIPWNMYQWTGDPSILAEHYDAMKSWVDYVTSLEKNGHGWRDGVHYGDWLALDGDGGPAGYKGGTDDGYCAMFYYLYSTRILAAAAEVLERNCGAADGTDREPEAAGGTGSRTDEADRSAAGRQYIADAAHYRELAEEILQQIRDDYFSKTGRCCVDTQTAYLMAIRGGLSTDEKRMEERLVQKLEKNGGRLQTGFLGTPLLAETLTEIGRSDLSYGLLLNEDYPGWLYEVNLGATTIWERWNSMNPDGSVSSTGMNSFNHYAYGAIVQWIYERAAGLRRDPAVPGFREVCFAPVPDTKLGSCDVTFRSAAGTWKAHWKAVDDNTLEVSLSVPFGCGADVILPYLDPETAEKSGNPLFAERSGNPVPAEKNRNPVSAEKRPEAFHVGPGDYAVTYRTTQPLRKVFSIDMPLNELLAAPKVKAALEKIMPEIDQLPENYRKVSFRTTILGFSRSGTAHISEAQMQGLDAMLRGIE